MPGGTGVPPVGSCTYEHRRSRFRQERGDLRFLLRTTMRSCWCRPSTADSCWVQQAMGETPMPHCITLPSPRG